MRTWSFVALFGLLVGCSDARERADPLLHPEYYPPPEDASIDAGTAGLDAATPPQDDAAAADGAAR